MKGFPHFICGLSIAACFPWTVQAAQAGNPLFFLLAGAAAILPDTLDLRVLRYFYTHQIEIMLDPLRPDPALLAQTLAKAIDTAHASTCRIRLNSMRTGPDAWQRYSVQFDPARHTVIVRLGPSVDMHRTPLTPPPHPAAKAVATARFHKDLQLAYLASFDVDGLDGPHLELVPVDHTQVRIDFIPWHRRWTHSLTSGGLLAILGSLLAGWRAIPVVLAAHASHVLLDQLGYMGSNLLWPLTHNRTPGLKLVPADSTFGNLATVWLSLVLLYGNLHTHAADVSHLPPLGYLVLAGFLPLLVFRGLLGSPAARTPARCSEIATLHTPSK